MKIQVEVRAYQTMKSKLISKIFTQLKFKCLLNNVLTYLSIFFVLTYLSPLLLPLNFFMFSLVFQSFLNVVS